MKRAVCIDKEGPKELNPKIGKEEAILGVVHLDEMGGGAKL